MSDDNPTALTMTHALQPGAAQVCATKLPELCRMLGRADRTVKSVTDIGSGNRTGTAMHDHHLRTALRVTMRGALSLLTLALGAAPFAAPALTLEFPAPVAMTAETERPAGEAVLPVAAYQGGVVDTRRVAGDVTQTAWRVTSSGMTTAQLMAPLRRQLLADGFDVIFDCRDRVCGGFDFRFAVDVIGAPAMYVDLGDFRYLMAQRGTEAVGLLVSRAPGAGYVQLTHVGDQSAKPAPEVIVTSTKSVDFAVPPVSGPLLDGLIENGRAPLDDLLFQTGSATLTQDDFPSLRALAAFLAANPDRTVTLVGHTDDTGGLEGNIALSKRRALAVRARLVKDFNVPDAQLDAEGVGYLAPRTSNATDEGRLSNRRVEVVLTD